MRDALIHFLTGERNPLDRDAVCRELERLGLFSMDIPSAPQWEWGDALEELIGEGVVVQNGRAISLNRERISHTEEPEQKPDPQLELSVM